MAKTAVSTYFDKLIHHSNQKSVHPNDVKAIRKLIDTATAEVPKNYKDVGERIIKAMEKVLEAEAHLTDLTVALEDIAIESDELDEGVKMNKSVVKESASLSDMIADSAKIFGRSFGE